MNFKITSFYFPKLPNNTHWCHVESKLKKEQNVNPFELFRNHISNKDITVIYQIHISSQWG